MKEAKLFQLQKFYKQRHLWDDCFPDFVKKCKDIEKEMDSLEGKSFSVRARPRQLLMKWFLERIKKTDNIKEILSKIPDDELIPIDGVMMTKDKFNKEFYGIITRTISSKSAKGESTKEEEIKKEVKKEESTDLSKQAVQIKVPKIQDSFKNGKPIFKMVANFHAIGGGEMSAINIMKMFVEKGYYVQLHPTQQVNNNLKARLPEDVEICETMMNGEVTGGSEVALIYANDFVYKLSKCPDNVERILDNSKRNAICLNFVMGESWQPKWRDRIHKYLFLNTTKENEVLERWKEKKMEARPTLALAPPVFLDEYLKIKPDYSKINFSRTGRYNGKYEEKEINYIIDEWQKITPESDYWFMATPPFLRNKFKDNPHFNLINWDGMPIHELLAQSSLYWYHLPAKMFDQGPRTLVESSGSAIPAIVCNYPCGPRERVVHGKTGWICDTKEDFVEVVRTVKDNIGLLKEYGENARDHAVTTFNPYRWFDEIVGDN